MKSIFCLLSGLMLAFSAWAQGGMIAGILTDENDNPVRNATIVISKAQRAVEVHTDAGGLFYSQLLRSDLYRIDVIVDGTYLKAGKFFVADAGGKKKFYHLRVVNNKVQVRIDGEDPFWRAGISKLQQQDPMSYFIYDKPGITMHFIKNTGDSAISPIDHSSTPLPSIR